MGHASEPARRISFTRAELKSFTGATLPDLIAEGVRLLAGAYREVALAAAIELGVP